jgi:hypothetical protein
MLDAEDHDPEPNADLRRGKARAIEMLHGVPHIDQQRFQCDGAKGADRLRDPEQPGVAHLENFAYCHGYEYLIGLFHERLCLVFYT